MSHQPTGFHPPIDLASARAARAKRKLRAGPIQRVPSDFMPFDYGVDPENDHPVEGGGIPWRAIALIGGASVVCLGLVVRGIYSFFN